MGYVRHLLALSGPGIVADPSLEASRALAAKLTVDGAHTADPVEIVTRLVLRGSDVQGRIPTVVKEALERAKGDLARALTLVEFATAWRPLVLTSDKLASAFGLERRSPYLARDIVELSYRLPVEYKVEGQARGKRILRDAARSFGLRSDLCDTQGKLGFGSAVPRWLNGPLAAWADTRIRSVRPIPHARAHGLRMAHSANRKECGMTGRRVATVV
jgi:asparagine synthase (glutamine-hydrolysing)